MTAIAKALKLPVDELEALQRTAARQGGSVAAGGPGRLIGEWEPHDLEIHPAGRGRGASGSDTSAARALPGYVAREHDRVLAEAVEDAAAGRSGIVVLIGTSSTGKTRACWEAVQPLAGQGWRLWHPFDPTRAQAALEDLHRVGPRTVVWLNEAQHYFGDWEVGERIAAAAHRLLLSRERGPVLVLGTLWPEIARRYMSLPASPEEDPYSRTRELISGHTLTVPETFDSRALTVAAALADGGDRLLEDALTRARADGRVTQDLAGAPELLNRFRHASPGAKAVLEAASDARRLGVGLHLSQGFLTDAALDYLTDTDYDQLTEDWAEQAYAELAEPVRGKQAPLRRAAPRPPRRPPAPVAEAAASATTGPQFRLAEYLEQHGLTTRSHLCPPASFWHAAHKHLAQPEDLNNLAEAAEERHRLQWAHHLRHRAADRGSILALHHLARIRKVAIDLTVAMPYLQRAADLGDTKALEDLAEIRDRIGDRKGAKALLREAIARGNTSALYRLADLLEDSGNRKGAEALLQPAAEGGDTTALYRLAMLRWQAKDMEGAVDLLQEAANLGDTEALHDLAVMREEMGDRKGAEALAREASPRVLISNLTRLARVREELGNVQGAKSLLQQAADRGDTMALYRLAMMQEEAGDGEGAEALARRAWDHENTVVLRHLARVREQAGDREGAEALVRRAADCGHAEAMCLLAEMRRKAGDLQGAEALLQQAIDCGSTEALYKVAEMREKAGDRKGAETLVRPAVDRGDTKLYGAGDRHELLSKLWPNGLDPDGTQALPWKP